MENEEKLVKVEWKSVFTLEEAEVWELDEDDESDEQTIIRIGKICDLEWLWERFGSQAKTERSSA